jgi:hypothetical protein
MRFIYSRAVLLAASLALLAAFVAEERVIWGN